VKAEALDSALTNLGTFPKDCILLSVKEKGGGESLPYSPPELVQPAGDHLHTEGVYSHAGRLRSFERLDAKAVLKIVGEFLKPCGNQVQVSCSFSPLLGFTHWKAKIGWLWG
jgi:hypothetical protein